jgi:hypothetical protein
MKHMQYVGPRLDLRGRTALVREDEQNPLRVWAQFDFPETQTRYSRDDLRAMPSQHPECFGWHAFYPADFVDTEELTHEVRAIRDPLVPA